METIRIRPSNRLQSQPELFLLRVFPPAREDGVPGPEDWVRIKPGLVVGREPVEAERLAVCDATMSRRHFRISGEGGMLTLDDLGSANGTHVNGRRVTSARIGAGDVIKAGSSLMLVCAREPNRVLCHESDGAVVVSPIMADAVERLRSIASSKVPVFLVGGTGVGKDLFAALLHKWSRRPGEFCIVNCAAIPETLAESVLFGSVKGSYTGSMRSEQGWFRKADSGTLFLDELGDMPLTMQVKLNRAIETSEVTPVGTTETNPVDVRVVAATNRMSLLGGRDPGFRSDLLGRLEDEVVIIPPLNERKEDIVPLLLFAAAREGRSAGNLHVSFVEKALLHPWPRNVRQLLKVVGGALRKTAVDGLVDDVEFDLRGDLTTSEGAKSMADGGASESWDDRPLSFEVVKDALARSEGNVSAAARLLGINRRRMYRVMGMLGLVPKGVEVTEVDRPEGEP